MIKYSFLTLAGLFGSFFAILCPAAPVYSDLWGQAGEIWTPQSRLPDFSFAGYQGGEQGIPTPDVTANVRDFGAIGDGVADDTAAFKAAILATSSGAILVPAGRYKITDFVTINKPNLVLRGEGSTLSVLYFPQTLTDVLPNWGATTTGLATSNYSWSGGFLRIRGSSLGQSTKATVVSPYAKRGDFWLPVSTVAGLTVGQWMNVKMTDDSSLSLATWLYNNAPGSLTSLGIRSTMQVAKIVEIDTTGRRIRMDRPLRFNVQSNWNPEVQSLNPPVTNSGIENLGFEFPVKPYGGHFSERGYNPLDMGNCAHCWIRNVRIANCDSGIFVSGVHNTVSNVVFVSARTPNASNTGHHGISVGGSDNLITGFDFQQRFIHDLSVEGMGCSGNVFSDGKGQDLSFDHHKKAPFANLFTNIDCGAGTRIWSSGGGSNLGKNTAGWATFWNIRASRNLAYPSSSFGPWSINIVGITSADASVKLATGKWYETVKPADLVPQNIHKAQLTRRLAPPVISHIPPQIVPEDTATGLIPFTVADDFSSAVWLIVGATSSNATLVPPSGLILGGSGAKRTIKITPAANQSGVATITILASDGLSVGRQTFLLSVKEVNDAPPQAQNFAASAMEDQFIDIDLRSLASDSETADRNLLFTVSNASNGTVNLLADGYTARFVPNPNFHGAAQFGYEVTDVGLDNRLHFHYGFDPPDTLTDFFVQDNSGNLRDASFEAAGSGRGFYTANVPSALSQHSVMALEFTENGDGNASRLKRSITPAEWNLGRADWTYSGWFQRLRNTNEDFLFYLGEGDGFSGNGDELQLYCPAGQNTLILRHFNSGNTVDVNLVSSATVGVGQWHHAAVTFKAATVGGQFSLYLNGILVGSATVPFTPQQTMPMVLGGTSGSPQGRSSRWFHGRFDELAFFKDDLSSADVARLATRTLGHFAGRTATASVNLTITPVNDAPVISTISNQNTPANTARGPIPFTIGDWETNAASLTVTGTSSHTTLVPNANIVFGGSGSNRTVTITPAANQSGSSTITLAVSDGILVTKKAFVIQVAPPPFTSVNPVASVVGHQAGRSTITVSSNTLWNVVESIPWATVTPANGSNNGSITVSFEENKGAAARQGDIVIGGRVHRFNQSAAPDEYGNTLATAHRLVFPHFGKLSLPGILQSPTDQDWFRFDMTVAGSLAAEVNSAALVTMDLYRGEGASVSLIQATGNGGAGKIALIRYLPRGTYYLKIQGNTSLYTFGLQSRLAGDFNNDRKADIIMQSQDTGGAALWHQDNRTTLWRGTFTTQVANASWQLVNQADLNGDLSPDLVWQNRFSGDISLWFLDKWNRIPGGGLLNTQPGTKDWRVAATGDFNDDGMIDLVLQHQVSGKARVWLLNRSRQVLATAYLSHNVVTPLWRLCGAGDINADGHEDLIWQNTTTGQINVWFMNRLRRTQEGPLNAQPGDKRWEVASLADSNADGFCDLILQDVITGKTMLWYLKGASVTKGGLLITQPAHPQWEIRNSRSW